jgi:hypothetical protein
MSRRSCSRSSLPAFLESEMCRQEVMRFRQREQELGRDDLIFPFRYLDVSDIKPDEVHDPAVLALLNSRQRFDFASLRHRPPDSEDVLTNVALLAKALRTRHCAGPWRPNDRRANLHRGRACSF